MKKFVIDCSYLGDGTSSLHCAECECENLHHEQVEVYARDSEDEGGLHVTVKGGERCAPPAVSIDRDMKGNPSSRRNGLAVRFNCEQCDAISEMTIVQHKGTTYMRMAVVAHRAKPAFKTSAQGDF